MDVARTVAQYISGVQTGKIVAGRLVKLAVRRHVADLKTGAARGLYFDRRIATEACEFFPRILRHTNSPWTGQPFELTPCQAFITWCLFGWRRKESGLRRFRKAYISCARKFGKTQYAAGLALLVMVADNPLEVGAEIYVAATKEDQANKMHREAVAMAEQSAADTIGKAATITKKNIAIQKYRSFFRPLGSDSKTNAGWNPHWVFLDELCDWQEHHRGLYGALTTAMGARRQPMRLVICTAGDDESRIWQEEDEFAVKVLDGSVTGQVIDDSYFAYIARIDESRTCYDCNGSGCSKCNAGVLPADDPMDEACWIKAQPNLGHTVSVEYYREQANEAKHKPTAMNDFIRYLCNKRATSRERAIDMTLWWKCAGEFADWSGCDTYGAFDLGRKTDLASIAVACKFPLGSDDAGRERFRYEVRQWSFTHEEVDLPLQREPWATFIRRGELIVTHGNVIDLPGAFKDKLLAVTEEYNVIQWAHDPHNAATMAIDLANNYGIATYEFRQTHEMYNESLDAFLKAVAGGEFCYGNDELMTFAAGNLVISRNSRNNWMPNKGRNDDKIDPIVAGIMAFGGAMSHCVSTKFWQRSDGVLL